MAETTPPRGDEEEPGDPNSEEQAQPGVVWRCRGVGFVAADAAGNCIQRRCFGLRQGQPVLKAPGEPPKWRTLCFGDLTSSPNDPALCLGVKVEVETVVSPEDEDDIGSSNFAGAAAPPPQPLWGYTARRLFERSCRLWQGARVPPPVYPRELSQQAWRIWRQFGFLFLRRNEG